jgi:hypothetical protein
VITVIAKLVVLSQIIEKKLHMVITKIGVITDERGLEIKGLDGNCQSYRHF